MSDEKIILHDNGQVERVAVAPTNQADLEFAEALRKSSGDLIGTPLAKPAPPPTAAPAAEVPKQHVIVYAFDVDHTLEVSEGPVTLASMMELRTQGHIVGLCGNWGVFVMRVPGWWHLISFFNVGQIKNVYLWELAQRIQADEYVMVGNIGPLDAASWGFPQTGGSDDMSQARGAGWRFIKEADFANGSR